MSKFPEHELAHTHLDGLKGIEIGGSAHNPFNIKGCLNVDYTSSLDTPFKRAEIEQCGEALKVDIIDDGECLHTIEDNSQDFVLSSHVLEHFPNLLNALNNWIRVCKDGGLIFMIVPKRDALESDKNRPLTSINHVFYDWVKKKNVTNHEGDPYGHYHVFTFESLRAIIKHFYSYKPKKLTLVDYEETDSKVGNGFTLVYRVSK